jgi:hypothetical protein
MKSSPDCTPNPPGKAAACTVEMNPLQPTHFDKEIDMIKFIAIALACAAAAFALAAHAEPGFRARGGVNADGQGNVHGAAGNGFSTAAGGQGLRTSKFNRSADGSLAASNNASVTTANGGSAERNGSFSRSTDGTASGWRDTTVTNASTGVTFNGSTSYTQGSGVSRSASCKDASGNTVSCGSR